MDVQKNRSEEIIRDQINVKHMRML